jgi:multidrug resistance efflux pump
LLAWVILGLVTTGHEFAHGLTCKHYGGEVHEIGFMLMFFMPCFYCNVTDAWLIRERSKRLWVTAAGTYFDLCLWAVATLIWRVTLPGTMPYHVSWIVMSICGGRVFININPLVKLDGYYFLSDWLEIPNLRQRSLDHLSAHVRWVLWGAPRPEPAPRGTLLFWFGAVSLAFTLFYVSLMLIAMHQLFLKSLGTFGLLMVVGLGWIILPGLIGDFFSGEVTKMLTSRWKRSAIWVGALVVLVVLGFAIQIDDWVSAPFKSRASVRVEIRAPVSGFLRVTYFEEGQNVGSGSHLFSMDIPDLSSKLTQKLAEEREVEARLRLLQVGARPEELAEQRQKVERAKEWRDRASIDLERKKKGFKEELTRLDEHITQAQTQLAFNQGLFERARRLVDKKSLPYDHYLDAERQVKLSEAQLQQAEAQKRERQAVGLLDFESELAKREKDCADACAALRLLEAGARSEEIDAEKARQARIKEERTFLEKQQERLKLVSPIGGVIVTPRLSEKIGHYFKEGDLICEIEEPRSMEVEIPLEEQDLARIATGMRVELKPRSKPYDTVAAKVTKIAPQATLGKVQSTVNVCCMPDDGPSELIANTTGYARIYTSQSSIAGYLTHRVWRYFRTEIWW